MRIAGNGATTAAKRTVSIFAIFAGAAALAATVAVLPAAAKKNETPKNGEKTDQTAVDPNQPMLWPMTG